MKISDLERKCISGHALYVPGKSVEAVQRELGLSDIIKMASNENPLGTSPKAIKAMQEEVLKVFQYPEGGCPVLTRMLAEKHGVEESQIYIDNGGDGVIFHFVMAFLNPGEVGITARTTFSAYFESVTNMDGKMIETELTADGRFDLDAIAAAVTDNTKLIFICNPNNPTGTIVTEAEVRAFLKKIPDRVLVLMDEAYCDFADSEDYPDSIAMIKDYPNVAVLRTFSKVMGLAGTRCGYLVSSPEVVHAMMKVRDPFPVNRIAQAGAAASLGDKEFYDATVKNNAEGREILYKGLEELGLSYYRSQSNFVFVMLGRPSAPVAEAMLKKGVIVRQTGGFGAPEAIRISVGLPEQNRRCLEVLKEVLA